MATRDPLRQLQTIFKNPTKGGSVLKVTGDWTLKGYLRILMVIQKPTKHEFWKDIKRFIKGPQNLNFERIMGGLLKFFNDLENMNFERTFGG